ncbi:unnamed protein product [Mycena citricolor]|uniref:LCCL domain-containing protein n=1 Tax=Mycena citricolor TaxID=2018698 RepID=A0AAD2HPN8_9AGAR|nr:unnamed protein product [Mycena citricolor]CAK5280169.1 unnamed protein product [Mycena citricolor]
MSGESSKTSSSRTQSVDFLSHDLPASKPPIHTFDVEDARPTLDIHQPARGGFVARIRQQSARFPRLNKVFLWLRGPRPKVDLPDPKPFLDIDFHVRGRHISLPLERTWLRLTRFVPSHLLTVVLVAAYIISLAFFARAQFFQTPADAFISCTATYWLSEGNCGLDGQACAPFNGSSLDFRCPAGCAGVILANPRTVGDEEMDFVPLIVGGGDANRTYRGDSFICAAAIQSGLISNRRGGCGTLDLVGTFANFLPTSGNGLNSIGFPTVFPLSFRFRQVTSLHHCTDLRDYALVFNALVTAALFLLVRPKPIVLFWCLVSIGYWHIVLFSQPGGPPPPLDVAFGTFLPALFIAYAFWSMAWRWCLPAFKRAPIEAMVLYLLPYWVGVLAGETTDRLPLQRLTASDLHKRSGAIVTLLVIIVIIILVAIIQLRDFRRTGWLPYYVGWYVAGGLVVMVLGLLPTLVLRIHHYFLAMVLMPGTGLPTRVSALAQGYLLGLFLNGAAAYGFDPILQTHADLVQDATLGSDLATFVTNSSTYNATIPLVNQTLFWSPPPAGWDGFSLLIDDVQRYVGPALNFSLAALQTGLPHFFRLALTSSGTPGDYTHAAVLEPNGTWIDPAPGAT